MNKLPAIKLKTREENSKFMIKDFLLILGKYEDIYIIYSKYNLFFFNNNLNYC